MGENLKVDEVLMKSVQQLLEVENRRHALVPRLTLPELRIEPIDFYQLAPAEYGWEGFANLGGGSKIPMSKNSSLLLGTFWKPSTALETWSCINSGNLHCPPGHMTLFFGVQWLFPSGETK